MEGRSVLLCHGSPLKTDEYVYPNASIEARSNLVSPTHDLVVYGHTHHPIVWEDAGKIIVNPGSIGQQRNGVLGAHWALWETESHSISFHVSPYASSKLMNECRMRDPQLPYLADVLQRVRH
jgi:predicted phosphodiesterase